MNWAYIAGFFDGEGSIHVPMGQKFVTSVFISLYQSDQLPLLRIQKFLESHGIHCKVRQEKRIREGPHRIVSKKEQYILEFSKKESAYIFLRSIRPYSLVKKQIVEDCIRYLKIFPPMTKAQREWRRVEGMHLRRERAANG